MLTRTKTYPPFKYQICGPKNKNYIMITGFDDSIKHLVIPSYINGAPVKMLGYASFARKNIESVEMPDTLTKIGPQAFAGCCNLKEISFPDSVKEIGYDVCCACKNLEKVKWSQSTINIYSSAFQFCNNLKSITNIDSVERIMKNAFNKTGFTSFRIPPKLKVLSYFAFGGCDNLRVVKMNHLPEIHENVFLNSEKVQIDCGGNEFVKKWAQINNIPITENKLNAFLSDINEKSEINERGCDEVC